MDNLNDKNDGYWRSKLTPEQYQIMRQKGTEPAFTGQYHDNHDSGTYLCAGCGGQLFSSVAKFDSGSGWPSFYDSLDKSKIKLMPDNSHGLRRTEVVCAKCGGHLGHLFDDGPADKTGRRYCINSCALDFQKK